MQKTKFASTIRQRALPFLLSVSVIGGLAGCSLPNKLPGSVSEFIDGDKSIRPDGVSPFVGAVIADEPYAAIAGQKVLEQDGNAVDAAVATYFTLSVTYPQAASLTGGGACLVWDPKEEEVTGLSFPPLEPKAGGPVAVPGNAMGFAVLHSRYGLKDWRGLVGNAEKKARFGYNLSRSMQVQIKADMAVVAADPYLSRTFLDRGKVKAIGSKIENQGLADTLARLRTGGGADFYRGLSAQAFLRASAEQGGQVTRDDLKAYRPTWVDPHVLGAGYDSIYLMTKPFGGSLAFGQMWLMLAERYFDVDDDERPHLLVETQARALTDIKVLKKPSTFHANLAMRTYNPKQATARRAIEPAASQASATTSFITVDQRGMAVACGVSSEKAYGTGQVDRASGLVLTPTGVSAHGYKSVGPVLVVNRNTNELIFAGSASGGVYGPAALMEVFLNSRIEEKQLKKAVDTARYAIAEQKGAVAQEPGANPKIAQDLVQRGHAVVQGSQLGRVNALLCPKGFNEDSAALCAGVADKRSHGLAQGGFQQ